jgi:hypothetical protein
MRDVWYQCDFPLTTVTLSSIPQNVDRCFRVAAVVGGVRGPWSASWIHRQAGAGVVLLQAPDPVWLSAASSSSATLNWSPVPGEIGGYEIWRATVFDNQCDPWSFSQVASSGTLSLIDSTLTPGVGYCWMVRALGSSGPGQFSLPVRTDRPGSSAQAPSVTSMDVMPGMAIAILESPSPAIKAYELWVSTLDPVAGCNAWSSRPTQVADMRQVIMIHTLNPQTRYCFKFKGQMTSGGKTESSPIVIFATPATDTAGAPKVGTSISGVDVGTSSIAVFAGLATPQGQAESFEVWGASFAAGSCLGWQRKSVTLISSGSPVVTNLTPGSTYCLSVLAVNASGWASGDFSPITVVSTRVTVNGGTAAPSFVFQHPVGNDDVADDSWMTQLEFSTSDADSVASVTFYAKPSSTMPCESGGAVPLSGKRALSTSNLNTGVFKFDRGMIPFPGFVWFCAVVDDGVNPSFGVISGRYENLTPDACTWKGTSDQNWINPGNWLGCINIPHNNTPSPTDRVVIYPLGPSVLHMPTLSAPKSIRGFAPTSKAWINIPMLRLAPNGHLTLNQAAAAETLFAGAISIQAEPGCSTGDSCMVTLVQQSMPLVPTIWGGQLQLSGPVRLNALDRSLYVGDTRKAGALMVNGQMSMPPATSDILTWPTIMSTDTEGFRGIWIDGSPFSPSGVQLSKAVIKDVGDSVIQTALTLRDYFVVEQIAEVVFESRPSLSPAAAIDIGAGQCANNSRFNPASFGQGLYFGGTWTHNIVTPPLSTCSPTLIPTLTIAPLTGLTSNGSPLPSDAASFGEPNELDDLGIINWGI